jgi:glycosyltransferase involved in cell wall biosynthesis
MSLEARDITIVVTVYDRRDFLKQSIESALSQTVPVRVMVMEDCGPDPGLEAYARKEFGARITYVRSLQRRGIFGNWNACLENCPTPWLSILHDDDYLKPCFVETMLELSKQVVRRGLYYGQTSIVDVKGNPRRQWMTLPFSKPWMPVQLTDVLVAAPFPFPGQLFNVSAARDLGGFRETSLFCGEWELWAKIIAFHGAARCETPVAVFREHEGWSRGTNRIHRSGKTYGLVTVQCKRNLALASRLQMSIPDAARELVRAPLPTRYLLEYAKFFTPRYLSYNMSRMQRARPPHRFYSLFQAASRVGGPAFIRFSSQVWHLLRRSD